MPEQQRTSHGDHELPSSALLFTLPCAIPCNAVLELHARAAEAVEGTADGQVDLSSAQPGHEVEIVQRPATARVRDWNRAPIGQPSHELLVDSALQTLVVCRVDEELGTVRLELLDAFWRAVQCQ